MSGGGKKPEFNFNPSSFKFDFAANPGGNDGSDDEKPSGGSGGSPKGPGGLPGGMKFTPDMMAAIQAKLGAMVGLGSGLFETLPKPVQRRIKALEGLHEQYEDLNNDFEKELYALEKKYEGLYKPLFSRRAEIVTGKAEPTDEEVEAAPSRGDSDDEGPKIEEVKEEGDSAIVVKKEEEDEAVVGIPKFWLGALQSYDEELIQIEEEFDEAPKDQKKEVDSDGEELEEDLYSGFKLTFHFAPNDYFSNATLTKTFFMTMDEEDQLVFSHSESDKIDWKAGKNLTVHTVQKQVGGGGRGGKRGRGGRGRGGGGGGPPKTIQVEEPTASFFNFFCSQGQDDMAEATEEEQEKAEHYYEIGETIRNTIIPRAVLWYLGEARGPTDEEMMAQLGGFDDDYDSGEDGDFDPKAAGQQAPECKQQ